MKKDYNFAFIIAVFITISVLIIGPSTPSELKAYGQSNETNLEAKNTFQTIPENSPKENGVTPVVEKESISENTSASPESDGNNHNEHSSNETNQEVVAGTSDSQQPDGDCLFDPSLPKCGPDENGNCPEGFARNGDDQCYPRHDRCPEGYHSHEDDESGRCIPDNIPCDPGFIMNPDYPSCENKDRICQNHHALETCKEDDVTNNLPYKSGYTHGCSDAKISDTSKRYINQPGKGGGFHTNEFLRGYNDGFEKCVFENNQPPSNAKGVFKVIVEVTNQAPRDIKGWITISIDHKPDNIVKSINAIHFPANGVIHKSFTFKASEVPVETDYVVNLSWPNITLAKDENLHEFGENSPEKRPEIVHFVIP